MKIRPTLSTAPAPISSPNVPSPSSPTPLEIIPPAASPKTNGTASATGIATSTRKSPNGAQQVKESTAGTPPAAPPFHTKPKTKSPAPTQGNTAPATTVSTPLPSPTAPPTSPKPTVPTAPPERLPPPPPPAPALDSEVYRVTPSRDSGRLPPHSPKTQQ